MRCYEFINAIIPLSLYMALTTATRDANRVAPMLGAICQNRFQVLGSQTSLGATRFKGCNAALMRLMNKRSD